MILHEKVSAVANLIRNAALEKRHVSYRSLFAVFQKDEKSENVFDTLERACLELSPFQDAIYSVVLRKVSPQLPGDGFFDMFSIHRADEFTEIAGNTIIQELTEDQKQQMASTEFLRVTAHAQKHFLNS